MKWEVAVCTLGDADDFTKYTKSSAKRDIKDYVQSQGIANIQLLSENIAISNVEQSGLNKSYPYKIECSGASIRIVQLHYIA